MNTILLTCIEERTGSKYLRIADGIEEAVGKGKLRSGERLPPQRELADQLGVTLGTVSRGYREAEKRGLLQGETGRGTFVRSVEKDSFSLHSLHNLPDRDSMPLVQFDLNFPVRAGHPDLAALLKELSGRVDLDQFLDYRPTAGLRQHRMTAAKWLSDFGLTVSSDQIAVTAGVQHGLLAVLASLMQAGEVLAVEQYTYPGMLNLASHLGIRLVPVPMDENGVHPRSLASLARQHRIRGLYMMSNLQNPTTITMPEKRRWEIADMVEKMDLFLLEDDVYGILEPNAPKSIASLTPDRAFYFTGMSKAVAPGLRIGFVAAPKGKMEAIEAAMAASIWMAPPLMAEAACRWIDDGTALRVAAIKGKEAARRVALVTNALHVDGLKLQTGGLHLWLHLPQPWSAENFARKSAEEGVMLIPSANFCCGSHPEHQAVRICVGPPKSDEELLRGARILRELIAKGPHTPVPIP